MPEVASPLLYIGGAVLTVSMGIIGWFITRLIEKVDSLIDENIPGKIDSVAAQVARVDSQVQTLLAFKDEITYWRGRMNGALERKGEKFNGG